MGKTISKLGGKVFGGLDKLVGIDREGANKAAKAQAAATKAAADQVAQDNKYAAQANVQSIQATADQAAARAAANDLLGRPMDSADVDLSQTGDESDDEDLLGRKKGGVRGTYQGGGVSSGLSL